MAQFYSDRKYGEKIIMDTFQPWEPPDDPEVPTRMSNEMIDSYVDMSVKACTKGVNITDLLEGSATIIVTLSALFKLMLKNCPDREQQIYLQAFAKIIKELSDEKRKL